MVSITIKKPKQNIVETEKEIQAAEEKKRQSNSTKKIYDTKQGLKNNTSGYVGLELPDKKIFTGSEEDANLIESYYRRKKLQEYAKQQKEAQIRDEEETKTMRKKIQEEMNPTKPNVTGEQLAQVGQTSDLIKNPDELTSNIQRNVERRTAEEQLGNIPVLGGIFQANKATDLLRGQEVLGLKPQAALDVLSQQNRDIRDYLQDYSNENNYKKILGNIQNAKDNIRLSIKAANQPGKSQDAITDYNAALSRLNLVNEQLKIIGSQDQRKYVDEIITKQEEIQNFLSHNVPQLNILMQNALIKPDPNYYDAEVEKIMSGGFK